MGLAGFFIFLVIFGIIGFITEKIWGLNPYKICSDVGALVIVGGLLFAFLPTLFNPEDVNGNVNRIVNYFVSIVPGAIIGDAAGSFISAITGDGR